MPSSPDVDPLLDRINIHVEVPHVDYEKLADKRNVEDSKTIRARVQAARERQLERFKGTKITCNAEMGQTEVHEFCQTNASGEKLLKAAVQQLHLSARAYHCVLKLARTIADLAGSEMIVANHVAEAVQYRPGVREVEQIVVDFATLLLAQLPRNLVLDRYLRC